MEVGSHGVVMLEQQDDTIRGVRSPRRRGGGVGI